MDDLKHSDFKVEDDDNYGGNSIGIKEIALEQYRRCCVEGSKEMLRGGKKTQLMKGVPIEVEIPNQREIFINCVRMFEVVLAPDVVVNSEIKDNLDKIDQSWKEEERKLLKDYEEWKKNNQTNFKNVDDKVQNQIELIGIKYSRKKLILLSIMLKELNYYDEESAIG